MAYTFKHGDRPLDDFTIQRAVGRGGFGEVYYAISDGGREVALKYLRENPDVELRGVSHCINLKSPHLVSIFDVKKNADGEYFIVMEYCSGPSLRDLLIAEPRGFSPDKAAFFAREIAKGLAYLHDRGIVHRDLKPGNIFFDDGYVKIGDYGLSKFMSVSRHSAQTASVGTVHYMAPEIGSGNYSKGVDIYALGVMLYEMLLGKVPFEGGTMAEVLMKHLMTQPQLDELPAPFGRVIRKALEKDPKDRYQTVDDMIDEMLSGEEIQKSLAGFSAKSLEGAVRLGGRDRMDSPRPSPNPAPDVRGVQVHGEAGRRQTPQAQPWVPSGMPLPDKVARRIERLARKVDDQVAKLAVKGGGPPPPPRAPVAGPGGIPFAQPVAERSPQTKRVFLTVIMTVGLAVGYGLLIGNTIQIDGRGTEEIGIAAAMLVIGLIGGVSLGRTMVRWFNVSLGPVWAEKFIRACCAAPFLAIGCIPLFDIGFGVPVWLGLIAVSIFADWNKSFEANDDGEISFGRVFSTALGALIATAIVDVVIRDHPKDEPLMLMAAGVAAIASFIVQAGSSWAAHQARAQRKLQGALAGAGAPPMAPGNFDRDNAETLPGNRPGNGNPPTPPPVPGSGYTLMASTMHETMRAAREQSARRSGFFGFVRSAIDHEMREAREEPQAELPAGPALSPRPRNMLVRMFFSLVAFVFMGGAIVTFIISIPAMSRNTPYHDVTAAIAACTGFAAFMIFALRKTTAMKRIGFWRDTVRPFLISCTLFGIGGTITGIAREWDHVECWTTDCADASESTMLDGEVSAARADRDAVHTALVGREKAAELRAMAQEALGQIPSPYRPAVPPLPVVRNFADRDCVSCVGDEGRVAMVSGLVINSIMFLFLSLFTGGKPKPVVPPQPFLQHPEPATPTA